MLKTKNCESGGHFARTPRTIAMLIYPGVAPLDVAGPLQVFGLSRRERISLGGYTRQGLLAAGPWKKLARDANRQQ
jgi:hypothetical protein